MFNQKLVHVYVVALTVVLIFVNLSTKTHAEEMGEKIGKSILSELVTSEFGEFEEEDELIVEILSTDSDFRVAPQKYLNTKVYTKKAKSVTVSLANNKNNIIQDELANKQEVVLSPKRTKVISYIIKSGDSISTIARKFGLKVNTILWHNKLTSYSVIRPGDELEILPIDGVVHVVKNGENLSYISTKYDIGQTEILKANKIASASRLKINQSLLIPGGSKIQPVVKRVATQKVSGIKAITNFVKAPNAKPVAGNKMNWPTQGSIITQYYSWRHKGLDIANKTGTPLFAADAGTILESGWRTGYGYQVLIDHGGGKKTRYAHASKLYVKVGDKVDKGQTVAAMGSTGWSTGPHIHFEVIINGVKYNPLHYIKQN